MPNDNEFAFSRPLTDEEQSRFTPAGVQVGQTERPIYAAGKGKVAGPMKLTPGLSNNSAAVGYQRQYNSGDSGN